MPTFPATKLHFPFRGNFTAQIKEQTIQYNQTKSWRKKEKKKRCYKIIWFAQALHHEMTGDANCH